MAPDAAVPDLALGASDVAGADAGFGRRTMQRLVEANRQGFDSGTPQRRVHAVETALAAAQAEVTELKAGLHAFETSTIWRLTRPLRWAMERVHRPRRHGAKPDATAAPPAGGALLPYEDWILTEEPACLAALARPGIHRAVQAQRLGLVLLADADSGPALAALLAECPSTCTLFVLEQEGAPVGLPDDERLVRMPVPPGFEPGDGVGLALARLDVDLLCFLDARDRLAPTALALMADAVAQQPQLDLVFADEDWLDAAGRRERPFLKPGWDAELQRGRDLVGPFAFFRSALVRAAVPLAGPGWLHDLANQAAAAARPDRIHHIPAVLCHRTVPPPSIGAATAAQLRRCGVAARVEPVVDNPGWNRVVYDLPHPAPLVSVIIPTRDQAKLLRTCTEGVLHRTDYPHLELLIVDNGTVEPEALALLDALGADPRVQVLRQPGAFNWSALNNAAAARAAGAVLVLLNNDIAVLQPDWLTVLVSHAIQPGVGAVGAKLLYPDGRVQHAGLTTDQSGIPRHLFRYADGGAAGAFGLMGLAREVWGVTGACLAVARSVFFAVGGLNEALPVAYNDVDFCLRLAAHGYRTIWTPWARLEHRELATRPPDHTDGRRDQVRKELDRLLRDWGQLVLYDPFLNHNLHLVDEQPCLRRHRRDEAAGRQAAPRRSVQS